MIKAIKKIATKSQDYFLVSEKVHWTTRQLAKIFHEWTIRFRALVSAIWTFFFHFLHAKKLWAKATIEEKKYQALFAFMPDAAWRKSTVRHIHMPQKKQIEARMNFTEKKKWKCFVSCFISAIELPLPF